MDSDQNSQPLLSAERQSDSEDIQDADDDEDFNEFRQRRVVIAATPPIVADSSSGSRPGRSSSSHSDINDSDTHEIRDLESNTDDGDDDTEQLFKATNTVPNDRFSFTYMVFYLLGMTTLLPWNFFITAEDVSAYVVALVVMVLPLGFFSIHSKHHHCPNHPHIIKRNEFNFSVI